MQSKILISIVVAAALIGGFVGGYAMSGGKSSGDSTSPIAGGKKLSDNSSVAAPASYEPELAEITHRFPLTAADMKENVESAALAVTDDCVVHLAWASRVGADEWQTFLCNSQDRGITFSVPRVVASSAVHRVTSQSRGKTITREVRMLPRLVSAGKDLILGWVEAVDDNTAVKYFVARSTDGGQTFSSPIATSTTAGARPTYTSLAAGPQGQVAASWLDNRQKVQLPAASVSGDANAAFDGDLLAYVPEDGKGVCPCCPTDIAVGSDGSLFLAFRNQKDSFRDMWIAKLRPGATEFDAAKPIVSPRWKFDGCPHDGPALVADADQLHIAWMDASSGQPRVYLAHGTSEIEGFEPREVAAESQFSQGHPAMILDAGKNLHVIWDEGNGESAPSAKPNRSHSHDHGHSSPAAGAESSRVIRYATFSESGERIGNPAAVAPIMDGFQTRPTVAVHNTGDVYAAWVELTAAGKSIAVARLKRAAAELVSEEEASR